MLLILLFTGWIEIFISILIPHIHIMTLSWESMLPYLLLDFSPKHVTCLTNGTLVDIICTDSYEHIITDSSELRVCD